MPVVTTRAASQNGGLATVRVGIAAPTISNLAINVLQLPLDVVFPLDLWPPSFSSPASRANDRNSALLCIVAFLPGVLFLRSSPSAARLREPLALVRFPLVAFPCAPVTAAAGRAVAGCARRQPARVPSPGYK